MNNSCTLKDAVSPWLTTTYYGIKKYLDLGTKVDLKPGAILYSPGIRCSDLYFLVSGDLKISLVHYDGQEKVIAFISPGGIIYEGPPASNNSSSIFVTAMGNSHLVKFTQDQLASLAEKDPEVAQDLVNYLHLKYKMVLSLYQGIIFYSPPQRLCRLLCLLSNSFGVKVEDKLIISHKLTQNQLAELLGVSRVTVANILKDMRQKEIIEIKSKSYIFSEEICTYCRSH